ncbi:hypothetical protein F4801DRAFT_530299 [Xylaria longipes]|nr:hypothetical protein F4801DRAFT_530299 [Xylaria longipes]
MAAVADQQPDFHALSGYLQGMSIEVDRCSNLVAVREANTVDAIAQLTTNLNDAVTTLTRSFNTAIAGLREEMRGEMAGLREEMRGEMAGLRGEMRQMRAWVESRLDDLDYNNRARTLNSMAIKPESILRPLKNTTTHEVVALPQTLKQLNALRVGEVEGFLEALGQVPAGGADEKKTQLKEFIGISSS